MTLIEDMSETQRQAWVTLIIDLFVFIYFLRTMTTSRSIDTLSANGLGSLMIGLIIMTIILHVVIAAVFAARGRSDDEGLKDERDVRIERKGATYGFYFLAIFMNIIIGHIVIQNGFDNLPNTTAGYVGPFDYTNTSHLVFALTAAVFIGDIIKNGVMVLAYRGANGR